VKRLLYGVVQSYIRLKTRQNECRGLAISWTVVAGVGVGEANLVWVHTKSASETRGSEIEATVVMIDKRW
jgi:hypothetical protein